MSGLILIADTSFFHECKAFGDIRWTDLPGVVESTELKIVVTRGVSKEIRSQKNAGNSRIAKSARNWNSVLFKAHKEGSVTLKESNPLVRISLDQSRDVPPGDEGIVICAKAYVDEGASVIVISGDFDVVDECARIGVESFFYT